MTTLLVCVGVVAFLCFVLLLAALRSGASDPGFQAGSDPTEPTEDDEKRAP